MPTIELIRNIAAASGLLFGLIYLLGGIITTAHLGRYGISEFHLLRTGYQTAGISYLVFAAIAFFAALNLVEQNNELFQTVPLFSDGLFLFSFFSIIVLGVLIWKTNRFTAHPAFVGIVLMALSILIDLAAADFLIQSRAGASIPIPASQSSDSILYISNTVLGHFLLAYYYGTRMYGQLFSSSKVILAVDSGAIQYFSSMRLPVHDCLSGPYLLIDETEKMYILGMGEGGSTRVVKIAKDLVKILSY